ncbi:MAG: integrase core domain-containing protein [Pseudomonadales bacterium]|nr:integrase core domain-containing protein [Pseudomonadales bacterium]
MSFLLTPWQLLLAILCGWATERQQQIIEFQNSQIEALLRLHGRKRILLSDEQRRLLAVKGKALGRKALRELTTIVTPDTILRWHRELVAKKWDYSDLRKKSPGRPRIRQVIVDLILKFARENPTWGYDRIQGALANVGYYISDTTVANVLRQHGIEPAPDRQRTGNWSTFLKAQWDVLAAIDFTTIEVWTKSGLVTFYLLFVMELKTRRVHFAGCTLNPDSQWMKQIARNLTNAEDGFLVGKQHVLMDRDGKFSPGFHEFLKAEGAKPIQLPPRSPNLNAYIERFMKSLKSEALSRMIFFGEGSLRRAVASYLEHYHAERNHQGLDNELIEPGDEAGRDSGEIECGERLGGMLKYYHRRAA